MKQIVCTACHTVGYSKTHTKGSFFIELVLWVCFLVPGLIYSIWRLTTKQKVCAACGNATLVPTNSPVGQKIIAESKAK